MTYFFNLLFCPKNSRYRKTPTSKVKNLIFLKFILSYLWECVWISGHFFNLFLFSWFSLGCKPKIRIMITSYYKNFFDTLWQTFRTHHHENPLFEIVVYNTLPIPIHKYNFYFLLILVQTCDKCLWENF